VKTDYIWPEFMPDQSDSSNVLLQATNVYPALDTYRPVKAFSSISTGLSDKFNGGASFISGGGTAYLLAGTMSGLEILGSGTWTTKIDGLTINARWKFEQFGDFVVCVNGLVTQNYDLSNDTVAPLATAPTGIDVTVVGEQFVAIAQPNGNRLRIQWSGVDDHTEWTVGTKSSGFKEFYTGGEVMGVVGGEYGLVMQRFAITRMNITGDAEAPFSFDQITNNYGCASKASIVSQGRTTFWLSDRGFMGIDDGQAIVAIGTEKIDRWFASRVPTEDYERIFTAIDPSNKLVFWAVPGAPGFMLIYNWELKRWTTSELNFTGLMSGYTSSESLEVVALKYPDIDTMPFSLDDTRFSGGTPRLYAVDATNALGTLTGDNLEARFRPALSEVSPGRRVKLRNLWPITDATTGIAIEVDHRQRRGDKENITNAMDIRTSGVMNVLCTGRYMRTVQTIAAGTVWSYTNGLTFEYEPDGPR
jgi:hypothetical protein